MPTLLADDIEHLRGRLAEFAAQGCQFDASKDMWAHRINSLCDLALKGLSASSPVGAVEAIRAAKEFFSQHNACPVGMDAVLERIAFAQSESTESYPGIAHDLETMRAALTNLLVQYGGVYDSVDNGGKRYQSQGAADAEVAARQAIQKAAPQPLTATTSSAPLQEGVGRGDAAVAALKDLVSLLLQTRTPIGPMRDRKDYPAELQRAIDFLHGRGSPSAKTCRTENPDADGA